jgi:hypothetical protein
LDRRSSYFYFSDSAWSPSKSVKLERIWLNDLAAIPFFPIERGAFVAEYAAEPHGV